MLGRGESATRMPLMARKGDTLQILVEDQGRVGYGEGQADQKGFIAPVRLGKTILKGWTAYSMPLDNPEELSKCDAVSFVS